MSASSRRRAMAACALTSLLLCSPLVAGEPVEGPFFIPPSLRPEAVSTAASSLVTGVIPSRPSTVAVSPVLLEGGGFPVLAPVTGLATSVGPYRYSRRLVSGAPEPPPLTGVFPKRLRPAGKTQKGIRFYGAGTADLEAVRAFGKLHAAIYDATGVTEPMALYDTLSLGLGGDLLDAEFQKQLGGNARLADEGNRVIIGTVIYEKVSKVSGGAKGKRLRARWWLSGKILHRSHVHMRLIRFEATFTLVPAKGPKARIVAMELHAVKPF